MAAIKISKFSGMIPKMSDKLLAPHQATESTNCTNDTGSLNPLKLPATVLALPGAAQTIKYIGSKWVSWNADVDVLESLLGNVNEEVMYGTLTSNGSTTTANFASQDFRRQGVAVGMLFTNLTNNESGVISTVNANDLVFAATATSNDSGDEFSITFTSSVDNRFYFTGDGAPKQSDETLIGTTNTGAPDADWYLGLPKPSTAPSVSANGTGDDVETTSYVYTYVNSFGEESEPSPPSASVTAVGTDWSSGGITLSNITDPFATANYNIDYINIYRLVTGTNSSDYQLVEQKQASAVIASGYTDTIATSALGRIILTENYNKPSEDLKGLTQMNNSVYAAFKLNEVFFSEPGKPHAFPKEYVVTLPDNVVGLASLDTHILAITDGTPYLIMGRDPQQLDVVPAPQPAPCLAKRGIVSTPYGVMFPAQNGMIVANSDRGKVLTEDLWTSDQWDALGTLSDMICLFHHETLYIFFNGTATGYYIEMGSGDSTVNKIDLTAASNTNLSYDIDIYGGYSDGTDLYLIGEANGTYSIYKWDDHATLKLDMAWTSKNHQTMELRNYGIGRVIAEGSTKFEYLIGGSAQSFAGGAFKTITTQEPFQLPDGKRGREFKLRVSGIYDVDNISVVDSIEELKE